MTIDQIKEIAYKAWRSAADAYRMYPENKHTFSEYWRLTEEQYGLDLKISQVKEYLSSCESDIGFMGSPEYDNKKAELTSLEKQREKL